MFLLFREYKGEEDERTGKCYYAKYKSEVILKKGALGAGAAAIAAGLVPRGLVFGRTEDDGVPVTKGDIAILMFLSALGQVEADLWVQE